MLRAGQAVVVIEAALGGVLELMHHKAPGLHVLYGVLPLLVAFIGEQLRLAAAQMVLGASKLMHKLHNVHNVASASSRCPIVTYTQKWLAEKMLLRLHNRAHRRSARAADACGAALLTPMSS